MYEDIDQIKKANHDAGQHFFAPDTMRFFRSHVLDGVYAGRYFVTSEIGPDNRRAYSVREALDDGQIKTVGEFQAYTDARYAIAQARKLADCVQFGHVWMHGEQKSFCTRCNTEVESVG